MQKRRRPTQSAPALRKRKPFSVSSSRIWLLLLVGGGSLLLIAAGVLYYELSLLEKNDGHTARGSIPVVGSKAGSKGGLLRKSSSAQNKSGPLDLVPTPSHLNPLTVPVLPIFAPVPNAESVMEDTLKGKPTMAGIIAILQKFILKLHESNRNLSATRADAMTIIRSFFDLSSQYLAPLDEAYRGKPVFPIRQDDSIFLSLAAFREHLLADTLDHAFRRAKHPEKLFVGAVVQNCFGRVLEDGITIDASGTPCRTGAQVVGKNKQGRDQTQVFDAPVDKNGIEDFCAMKPEYQTYCENGQIRVLYIHETESLGPAMARYYASKLWGGETFFVQTDSHLLFAEEWDEKYRVEIQATKSYPKAVLSSYPPGFQQSAANNNIVEETPGARLCHCETRVEDPSPIVRINTGRKYQGDEPRPTQIPFIAAGFFFTRAEFLVDVPFDPFVPWLFMGEEIALSMRAWTHGWDIYAPRKNLIAHQYRPGRMGLPKFWGSVNRL